MQIELNIIHASISHLSSIAKIYNHYLGKATMDLEPKDASYFQNWLKNKSEKEQLYVAQIEDQVIGWGMIKRYSDRRGYARAAETSVYFDPEWTGKGYGPQMKRIVMDEAQRLGYKHLVAKIWATNQVSIQYNIDFGYEIVGTQRQIGYVDGKWVDVVIMQYVYE